MCMDSDWRIWQARLKRCGIWCCLSNRFYPFYPFLPIKFLAQSLLQSEKTLPEMAGTMVPVKGYVVDKIDTMLRVPLAALQARSEEHLKHPDR